MVDTFFKKYTIVYTDEDNEKSGMILKFIRNYFKEPPEEGKIYLMEYQNHFYMVADFLDHPLINSLVITDEKLLANGNSIILRIKNAKRK